MSTRILSRLQPPDTSYWAIIKLSLPVWISNVAIVGGATLDTLMTGHLGSTDLAAVAIGLAVSVSVFVALVGVMQGLSPIAGHHYGAGHHERIGFELHQTIWLAILLAIIGMGLMCYTPMWMTLTNSTGRVAEIATNFLLINAIGLPAAMAGRAYMAMNAAVSRPKVQCGLRSLCWPSKPSPITSLSSAGPLFRVSEAQDVRSLLPSMRS